MKTIIALILSVLFFITAANADTKFLVYSNVEHFEYIYIDNFANYTITQHGNKITLEGTDNLAFSIALSDLYATVHQGLVSGTITGSDVEALLSELIALWVPVE